MVERLTKGPPAALLAAGLLAALQIAAPAWAQAGPATAPSAQTAAAGPADVITDFDSALIAAMKAGKASGIQKRIDILGPAVQAAFDVTRISQIVLGSYWDGFSPDQRSTFVDVFEDLIVATYASNFDSYSGETFTITGTRERGASALVATRMKNPRTGKTHSFDYVLQSGGGHWRIVNVVADGVSDVAVKRAEYTSVLEKGPFADLIQALRKQIVKAKEGG